MQLQSVPCRISEVCWACRCAHSRFPRVGMSCVSAIQVTELFIALSEWLELILIFPMRKAVVLQFLLKRNKNRCPAASIACRCWGESGSSLLRGVVLAVGSCLEKMLGQVGRTDASILIAGTAHTFRNNPCVSSAHRGVGVFAVPEFQSWWGGKSPPVTQRD